MVEIKVDIISGFLGAGKTTFIKKILGENFLKEKVVIIENEFGEVGIDGSFIKHGGFDILEINSGCICCSLVGDFSKAVVEVIEKLSPQRIIIEPSGVGKLSEVIKAVQKIDSKKGIVINSKIVVVDVTKYKLYSINFGEFFKDQISNACTIILTRIEKTNVQNIIKVVKEIKTLNKKGSIITTPLEKITAQKILLLAEGKCQNPDAPPLKLFPGESHGANEVFSFWGTETPNQYTKEELQSFLQNFSESDIYGHVLRAKGIVQSSNEEWIEFDYVPGEINIRSSLPDYTGRVCVIGKDIDKALISKLFSIQD